MRSLFILEFLQLNLQVTPNAAVISEVRVAFGKAAVGFSDYRSQSSKNLKDITLLLNVRSGINHSKNFLSILNRFETAEATNPLPNYSYTQFFF
jgi:hypothetical protein